VTRIDQGANLHGDTQNSIAAAQISTAIGFRCLGDFPQSREDGPPIPTMRTSPAQGTMQHRAREACSSYGNGNRRLGHDIACHRGFRV
jgi:hypothetical protein